MKILMLGWEYPPLISGGLATASEGLTRALAAQGVSISFVLPHLSGLEQAAHMEIFASKDLAIQAVATNPPTPEVAVTATSHSLIHTIHSAYARPITASSMQETFDVRPSVPEWALHRPPLTAMHDLVMIPPFQSPLFQEVERYTRNVLAIPEGFAVDIVHAHDWMTFPAAVMLAKSRKVPLVVHVHSLESDRCGDGGNALIHAIEHLGIKSADRIIAVSQYTRKVIIDHFAIAPHLVSVVHNGVTPIEPKATTKDDAKKRVLFLGRVTYQKGPDIFVEVASQVIRHFPSVVFVVAGDGDMLPSIRERVRYLQLEDHFEFPGFLTGERLDEEFCRADLYVMPSVSEPFGITPLEALSRGTPALISKQSGVAEVLTNVLKVDFWDQRKQADFIINSLLHPEIGRSMMAMSLSEVSRLRWENAASLVVSTYHRMLVHPTPSKAA